MLRPAPKNAAILDSTEPLVAATGDESFIEPLMPQAQLYVHLIAPQHDAAATAGALLPMVHVVPREAARGAEANMLATRMASFSSAGAALSISGHDHTAIMSSPRGETRKVRASVRS
jgi:arginine/ornithine N-succinyltransferase beta subunit